MLCVFKSKILFGHIRLFIINEITYFRNKFNLN